MRVCFQLQVKPDRLAEYKERHAHVWPDMLAALQETGWHNYSLFVRDDGLLIGYFETPSLEAAQAGMARTEVNGRWQAAMFPTVMLVANVATVGVLWFGGHRVEAGHMEVGALTA